jgi:hypothetical protein
MMSNGLISDVFMASASNSMWLETHVGPDLPHRNCGGQVSHGHQIVGGAGQGKYPVHFAHPAMPMAFPKLLPRVNSLLDKAAPRST